MATPSDIGESGSRRETCCPSCSTVFEVSRELLASSDTRVRCGECYSIFDARDALVNEGDGASDPPEGVDEPAPRGEPRPTSADTAVLAGLANDTAALDVTYSDFDFFSEDAELPEVAYFDQTRDTPDFDFDSVELDQDETFSDTLFINDVTLDARTGDATPVPGAGDAAPGTTAGSALAAVLAREVDVVASSVRRPALDFRYRDPDEPEPSGDAVGDGSGPPPADGAEGDAEATGGEGREERRSGHASDRAAVPNPLDALMPVGKPEPADPVRTSSRVAAEAVAGAALPLSIAAPDDALEPLLFETPPRRRGWGLPLVLLLALGALLVALYGLKERDRLDQDRFARPVLELFCRATGCTVPPREALDRIALVRRNVYSHPTIDDALVIDVSFRNEAAFEQALPALVVRLSDPSGRLVARRAFEPREYLPANGSSGPPLAAAGADKPSTSGRMDRASAVPPGAIAPGARLDISLEVTDPGRNASSFEVDFVPAARGVAGPA